MINRSAASRSPHAKNSHRKNIPNEKNEKISSNNNNKKTVHFVAASENDDGRGEPLVVISIDVAEGRKAEVKLYLDSDADKLAQLMVRQYSLTPAKQAQAILRQKLEFEMRKAVAKHKVLERKKETAHSLQNSDEQSSFSFKKTYSADEVPRQQQHQVRNVYRNQAPERLQGNSEKDSEEEGEVEEQQEDPEQERFYQRLIQPIMKRVEDSDAEKASAEGSVFSSDSDSDQARLEAEEEKKKAERKKFKQQLAETDKSRLYLQQKESF